MNTYRYTGNLTLLIYVEHMEVVDYCICLNIHELLATCENKILRN